MPNFSKSRTTEEEKQGDQRYVELTAEESEWVKSLINPKWKENVQTMRSTTKSAVFFQE